MHEHSRNDLSLDNHRKAKSDLALACRSLSALFYIAKPEDLGLQRLTETITQLLRMKEILKNTDLVKADLVEISEDMLHSVEMPSFVANIAKKFEDWLPDLQKTTQNVGIDISAGLMQKVYRRERVRETRHAAKLALEVKNACRAIMTGVLPKTIESTTPIEDAQEEELLIYDVTLSKLLLKHGGTNPMCTASNEDWKQAEKCLKSLEAYLKEHKIRADRLRNTDFNALIMLLLKSLEALDKEGVGQAIDVTQAEAVWGLVDKIGSAVHYLLHVDKNKPASDPHPTTRSIFLLVSAPPARFTFTRSRDEWRERELVKYKNTIHELLLNPNDPITPDDEGRWSIGFRELEALEDLFKDENLSSSNIRETELITTMAKVNQKVQSLLTSVDQAKIEEEYILMVVSLELCMRLMAKMRSLLV